MNFLIPMQKKIWFIMYIQVINAACILQTNGLINSNSLQNNY
jgi:hypothetical protein